MRQILSLRGLIEQIVTRYGLNDLVDNRTPFIQEQQLLIDKIMVEHFSLPVLFDTQLVQDTIASLQQRYHTLKTTQDIATKTLRDHQIFVQELQKKSQFLTQNIEQIQQSISVQQTINYEDMQHTLTTLQQQQGQLWKENQSKNIQTIL